MQEKGFGGEVESLEEKPKRYGVITEEQAMAICGSPEKFERVKDDFVNHKQFEYLLKGGGKLVYHPAENEWTMSGYGDRSDIKDVQAAVEAGYAGFIDDEPGTMEYIDGTDISKVPDREKIYSLASRVGVEISLFNRAFLHVIEVRPHLKFKIYSSGFGGERSILDVRNAINEGKPLLAEDAEERVKESIARMDSFERTYGEPLYDPNSIDNRPKKK